LQLTGYVSLRGWLLLLLGILLKLLCLLLSGFLSLLRLLGLN